MQLRACFCCPGRNVLKVFALLATYAAYLALGAAVFSAIESPIEARLVDTLRQARKNFLASFPQVTGELK
jgi:hypothetical protein